MFGLLPDLCGVFGVSVIAGVSAAVPAGISNGKSISLCLILCIACRLVFSLRRLFYKYNKFDGEMSDAFSGCRPNEQFVVFLIEMF